MRINFTDDKCPSDVSIEMIKSDTSSKKKRKMKAEQDAIKDKMKKRRLQLKADSKTRF